MISDRRLWRATPGLGVVGKLLRVNWLYALLICALAGVGYTALYSVAGGSPYPYAEPQTLRFGLGFVMMLALAMTPLRILSKLAWPAYAISIVMLLLVLKMGHVGKGAERWIIIGGTQVQPSEFAKIALAMALAAYFQHVSWERMRNPLWLIPPALLTLLPVALVLKEPNLGTAVIIGAVGATMFLAAGMRWWMVALLAAPIPMGMHIAYDHLHDYQRARITTFLHPESDPRGAGYNIIQSKIALGSGGVWGQGYLHGTQGQLNFLPEKQTDFIFTTIAEEWGLVGGLSVMALLLLLILGGMAMAISARSPFGRLLGLGIAVNFFLYCLVNLSMVMGAIPVGGVPLPLVSWGGSAMLMVMFGFGLLMSVFVHRHDEMLPKRAQDD